MLPTPGSQLPEASVASRPLASAAERQYRWADDETQTLSSEVSGRLSLVEGTGPALWAFILALPSGAVALLCAAAVVRKIRHPFGTSGRSAVFLRVVIGAGVGAIAFLAVLIGGVSFAMGRL